MIFLSVIFYNFRKFYLETARNVKRLEATSKQITICFSIFKRINCEFTGRSPILTHLSSTMMGLTTVRAHKCQSICQQVFDDSQNIHSSTWFMFLATTRWFGMWLDWMCAIYVACVTFACVSLRYGN